MPDTSIQQDKELRESLLAIAKRNAICIRRKLSREEYESEVWPLANNAIDELLKLIQARDKELERKARLQAASDILNLANEYACDDSTMRGSEEIRNYHYFNAIHKIGELSS